MGLFSSSKSSASNVTTTTVSTDNSLQTRDIGLTGINAVNLANATTRAGTTIASIGAAQNRSLGNNVKVFADEAFSFLNSAQENVFRANADLAERSNNLQATAGKSASDMVGAAAGIAQPGNELTKYAFIAVIGVVALMTMKGGF